MPAFISLKFSFKLNSYFIMFDRLNEMNKEQLLTIKDWYITVFSFMGDGAFCPGISDYINAHVAFMESFFENKILKGNKTALRGLKMALNDVIDSCRGLSPVDRKRLNDILRDKFGYDLNDADKKRTKKIEAIVTRGKLRSDTEYYLAKEWIDHLLWSGEAGDVEKAQELDMLLCEYEQKVAEKMEKANKRRKKERADD